MSPFGFGAEFGVDELVVGDGGDGLLRRDRARVSEGGLVLERADLLAAGAVGGQQDAGGDHAAENEPGAQGHGAEEELEGDHSDTRVRSQP